MTTIDKTARTAPLLPPDSPVDKEHLPKSADARIPTMIGYWDRSLHNRFGNLAYARWFGIDPAKMPGMHIRDVIGEERYRINLPYIEAALCGQAQQFERSVCTADGKLSWHGLVQYVPDFVAGQVQGVYLIVSDVSARKQTEAALHERDERLGALYETLPLGIAMVSLSGRLIDCNGAFRKISGYSTEELKALDYASLTPRSYAAAEAVQLEQLKHVGRYGPYEKEIRHKDGRLVPVSTNGVLISDSDAQQYVWCFLEDITKRKQLRAAWLEERDRIKLAVIATGLALYDWNPKTGAVQFDENWAAMFGYRVDELRPDYSTWLERVHPDDRPIARKATETAFRDDALDVREYRVRHRDGSWRWVMDQGRIMARDAQGEVIRFVGANIDITERKRLEQETLEQRRFLDAVIENVSANIYIKSHDGRYLYVNQAVAGLFGRPVADILGKSDLEILPPDSARQVMEFDSKVQLSGVKQESEEIFTDRSGNARYFWSIKIPIAMLDHPQALIGFSTDITDRKTAEEAQSIAAVAFESQQGMFITDANKVILRVNKAFTEVTGYTAEEAVGQTPRLLSSGQHDAAFYAAMWKSINDTGTWQGEIWNRRKNGKVYPEHLSISAVKNDAGVLTHYVGTFSDLTAYKAAEERIHDLAYTDLLTSLPNRRLLIIRLQQAIIAAAEQQHRGALLLVDLDHFKNLNDSLGHALGDQVLQRCAKRLGAAVRDEDTVARVGSDEFGVLVEHLSPDPEKALRQVQTVTDKILATLNKPYQLAGSEISCTASIGITFLGEQYEETLEPLKRAELAMYQAKSGGRARLCFFEPQMQAVVDARVLLERALQEAILKQQFALYYQAQVSDSEGIIGVEALLRWADPKRGMVSPGEFIPLAEETGLILPIGAWVLDTACQQLVAWAGQPGLSHLSIAVNVSARQFRESDFVQQVLATLKRTGANAQRLKLELTESVLIANAEDVIVKMNALKAIGVGFAIDDFGTGYSSLAYLKRLPLERLKIDQGFVRNILMDANDAAIARAVIALATSMGLGVTAEGVEIEGQREFLASLGCHTFQGYLFSRPVPVAEFEALVQRG